MNMYCSLNDLKANAAKSHAHQSYAQERDDAMGIPGNPITITSPPGVRPFLVFASIPVCDSGGFSLSVAETKSIKCQFNVKNVANYSFSFYLIET